MRFTVAWANVISENHVLKIALGALVAVLLGLAIVTIKLAGRKPLIIERICYSQALTTSNEEKSSVEVEAFVKEALSSRFDTLSQVRPGFLSPEEERFRNQEQIELKKKEMKQKIIVNGIKVEGKNISVDSDRLISVGAIRSALPFPLSLIVGTVSRSEANPYGLTVLQVSAPKPDSKQVGGK